MEEFLDGCMYYFEKEGLSCFFRFDRGQLDYLFVLRIEDLFDVLFMLYMYYVVGEVFMVCFINILEKGVFLEVSSVIGEVLEVKLYILLFYLMREVYSVVNSGCIYECILFELFEFIWEIFF